MSSAGKATLRRIREQAADVVRRYGGRLRMYHDVEFLACSCPATHALEAVPCRAVAVLTGPHAVEERVVCSCGVVSMIRNGEGSTLLGEVQR